MTVHHLLTHTSGIADYAEEDEHSVGYVKDYGDLWEQRPNSMMLRPADFLPPFGDRPAYRHPGQLWQYSNAGYVLLGLVIEEVSGRPIVLCNMEGMAGALRDAAIEAWQSTSSASA